MKNAVIFVGYQVVGTLGGEMIDGVRWVKIYGEDILVRASIQTVNRFSAHVEQSAIVKWASHSL